MVIIRQQEVNRQSYEKDEGTMGFHDYVTYKEDFNKFMSRVTQIANNIVNAEVLSISYPSEDKAVICYKNTDIVKIEDLIVSAEEVGTGKRIIGYVCGCKKCKTAFENEEYDKSRPIGLLTSPDCSFGNVRVYTDTMEIVKGYGVNEK